MDLLAAMGDDGGWQEAIGPGAVLLRQYATVQTNALLAALKQVTKESPFRKMQTPRGYFMSVELTACGHYGWISDRRGYRYSDIDPLNNRRWPAMPESFLHLARGAAAQAGYPDFTPDTCLINCYAPGTKMGLHQDKDERDFSAPIVSVSLGVPATFQWGGARRSDKPIKTLLQHGDIVVWGGAARLNFHGVLTLRKATHNLTGDRRFNLTFRKAR